MPGAVLSHTEIRKLMRQVDAIEKRSQVENMISEDEAAKILGFTIKTMQNKVCTGEMEGLFVVSPVGGKRFYYKDKILGL